MRVIVVAQDIFQDKLIFKKLTRIDKFLFGGSLKKKNELLEFKIAIKTIFEKRNCQLSTAIESLDLIFDFNF